MPVLPPVEASTMASSVVGTLTQLMPRLKVAAAKPPRSVTIPPPIHISVERRVAPVCDRKRHTSASDAMSLW